MKKIHNIIPLIPELLTWAGLIIIGVGALVTLYKLYSKKWTRADAFKFFSLNIFHGLLVGIAGMFLAFISEFEPFTFSSPYGTNLIFGLWLIVLGAFLIGNFASIIQKKENSESEKNLNKDENHHERKTSNR